MNRFRTGIMSRENEKIDDEYWTAWVRERMRVVREACSLVDTFIAPSEQLRKRFVEEFHLPADKVMYVFPRYNLRSFVEI